MSDSKTPEEEVIFVNFRAAYARKEIKEGRRIPFTECARELGVAYSTMIRYMNGKARVIDLDVLYKLMAWLGTSDFNDMFERRKVSDGTQGTIS